jgi:hypothetical protein
MDSSMVYGLPTLAFPACYHLQTYPSHGGYSMRMAAAL